MIMNHLNSTEYDHKQYKSLSQEEKQRLAEYKRNTINHEKIKPHYKERVIDFFNCFNFFIHFFLIYKK